MGFDRPDVLIIGAGIIGSSIAWHAARAGLSVRLKDAGTLGGEASSAGAGMLSPGGEFDQDLWARLAVESLNIYPHYVHELETETGLHIDFGIPGSRQYFHSVEEREAAVERAKRHAGLGIRSQLLDDGVLYPDDAFIDPGDVLKALRRSIELRGVDLRENCRVELIEDSEAGAIVIAAGAWSSQIQVRCRGRLIALHESIPVKGHLIGYRLEPGGLGPMRRYGHTYILQRASGFTIAGSTEQRMGFDRRVDDTICRDVHERAAQLWPRLRGETPSERWVGFRPATQNGKFQIGQVRDTNVWLAYGHFRNGILLAPVTARWIAGEIISSLGKG